VSLRQGAALAGQIRFGSGSYRNRLQGVRRAYRIRKKDPSGTWVADGQDLMSGNPDN
jgi:hypothetical protein